MVTISYAILVNDEYEEIQKLIGCIFENWKATDEIVVVQDYKGSIDKQTEDWKLVAEYLQGYTKFTKFSFFQHPLNNDFASQKNYLNSKCTSDYIFNIDADELPTEDLMINLHTIIEANPTSEVFIVPRINKVDGITQEHVGKWCWKIDEDGDINWPDWQWRIYKNNNEIKWEREVHEYLVDYKKFSYFPMDKILALKHFKKIDKQEKQNEHYAKIIKNKTN